MVHAFKPKRIACPHCYKRVALTKTGKLHSHTDSTTGKRCPRSGKRVD
jgi:uncharacterized OB-fold protein